LELLFLEPGKKMELPTQTSVKMALQKCEHPDVATTAAALAAALATGAPHGFGGGHEGKEEEEEEEGGGGLGGDGSCGLGCRTGHERSACRCMPLAEKRPKT
jgi:hypothetical protein